MTDTTMTGAPAGTAAAAPSDLRAGGLLTALLPLFIFGMLMAVPLLLVASTPDPLILAACTLCFSLVLMTGGKRNHALQYFFVVVLYLGLYPLFIQELTEVTLNVGGRRVSSMSPLTFAAVSLFLVAAAVPAVRFSRRPQPAAPLVIHAHRLVERSLLIPGLALLAFCALSILLIGSGGFFLSRFAAFASGPRSGAETFLIYVVKLTPCWFMVFLLYKRIRQGLSVLSLKVALLAAAILLINNPVTTPRFVALTGVLVAVFPLLLQAKRLAMFKLAFPLLVWLVLPLTSYMRVGRAQLEVMEIYRSVLSSLEFSSFATFNEWMLRASWHPLGWGWHTASAVFVFVPRTIWPGKNPGTGIAIAEELGYSFTNVGVPPIADALLDFGWLGVVALGLLTGAVLKRQRLRGLERFDCLSTRSCIPLMIFALTPLFVRGDLSTFFLAFYVLLVSHRLAALLVRLRA